MSGACHPAGGGVQFLNSVASGNSLGIRLVGSFAGAHILIKFTGAHYRADIDTIAAGGAGIQIDVAGFFVESDVKVTLLPVDGREGGIGVELDVKMPADLDQFGRDNSHGAFVGGKCFIQLSHHPTDSG